MRIMYIIRGIPGSGKTTLAHKLVGKENTYEADDFFYSEDGQYYFDAAKLSKAHQHCQRGVIKAVQEKACDIAVSNTFIRIWEFAVYYQIAEAYGLEPMIIECKGKFNNVHGVPQGKVDKMTAQFQSYFPHLMLQEQLSMWKNP